MYIFRLQGSAESYSQQSSDFSIEEDHEMIQKEARRLAQAQLEKARVCNWMNSLMYLFQHSKNGQINNILR